MTLVAFTVNGRAIPQGSKTIGRTKTGRSYVREDNAALDPWRKAVAGQARQAWNREPLDDPVDLAVVFYFKRPSSHYGTGRNAHVIKASAPLFPHDTRGTDLDKLTRAVADALTGIVIVDDVRIVTLTAAKVYAAHDHATIEVSYALKGVL